jgi:hypothetical protein
MRKGVILEVNHDSVTLLTPEGEFMRTRKLEQDYQIGEEISFFSLEADKKLPTWQRYLGQTRLRAAALGAAVILLGATAIFPVYQSNQVYAYMSIDVNPSIELGLNQKLKVVTIDAYNEAGERIVSKLKDWKKEDASAVAEKIFDEIESQGYLQQDKNVLIATANSEKQIDSSERQLEETIEEIKEAGKTDDFEVMVFAGTAEERASAVKQGVTMGAYKQKTLPQQAKPVVTPPVEQKKDSPAVEPVKKQQNLQPSSSERKQSPSENGKKSDSKGANEKNQSQSNGNGNNGSQKKMVQKEKEPNEKDHKGSQNQQRPGHSEKKPATQEKTTDRGKNHPAGDNRNKSDKNNGNGRGHEKVNGKGHGNDLVKDKPVGSKGKE